MKSLKKLIPFFGLSVKCTADNAKGYEYKKEKMYLTPAFIAKKLAYAKIGKDNVIAVCVFNPKGENQLYLKKTENGLEVTPA